VRSNTFKCNLELYLSLATLIVADDRIDEVKALIRDGGLKPETSNNRPVLTERARRSACRGRLVTAIDFRRAAGFVGKSLDQVGAVWAASQTIRCML